MSRSAATAHQDQHANSSEDVNADRLNATARIVIVTENVIIEMKTTQQQTMETCRDDN